MTDRDWHVLLLGGPSGTGKSTLVAELARSYDVTTCQIDDLEAAVTALTTPEQQPQLHYWNLHATTRSWTAEEILDVTIATIDALAPAIRAVVSTHLDHGPPVILEGDYLLPALARELSGPQVKAVFLYESEEQLLANFSSREPETEEQVLRSRVSALFGDRILSEAAEHDIPAVPARPWATLADRVRAVL